MVGFLEGGDLLIVAVIVLVLFGGSKLPQLARSLGEAQRELKNAMLDHDGPPPEQPSATSHPPAEPPPTRLPNNDEPRASGNGGDAAA